MSLTIEKLSKLIGHQTSRLDIEHRIIASPQYIQSYHLPRADLFTGLPPSPDLAENISTHVSQTLVAISTLLLLLLVH